MPDAREAVVAEGLAFESRIEAAATGEVWEYADWLLATFGAPQARGGRRTARPSAPLTVAEYAEYSQYAAGWLQEMRKSAHDFAPGVRVEGVSLKTHAQARRQHGSVVAAIEAIRGGATRTRQYGRQESAAATRRHLEQLPAEERALIAAEVLAEVDEETIEVVLMNDEPTRRGLERAGRVADRTHPAHRSRLPLDVPEPQVSFRTLLAGRLTAARQAVRNLAEQWEDHHADPGNDPVDVDYVRDAIAGLAAELTALTTDWEEVR